MAENMMELIDGYCRLENDTDDSVIHRPNRGVCDSATSAVFPNITGVKTDNRWHPDKNFMLY